LCRSMWERYGCWTVVPFLLAAVLSGEGWGRPLEVSAWSFAVIGVGALGCILGGRLSRGMCGARVAAGALAGSGAMCLAFPLAAQHAPVWLLLSALLIDPES